MNRIDDTFARLRRENRKALALFLTAGIPRPEDTARTVVALAAAGADLVELGLPFSDPIADGPTIQRSSARALQHGTTVEAALAIVREVRTRSQVPMVLMGYANPVLAYGVDRFFDGCRDAGADGAILADIPLEESAPYRRAAAARDLRLILLAAPTTPEARLRLLDEASTGFLYCVSVTGITGERSAVADQASSFIGRARSSVTRNPLLAGFGISTPRDAARLAARCDGVIIGSALVNILMDTATDPLGRATAFTQTIRAALDDPASAR